MDEVLEKLEGTIISLQGTDENKSNFDNLYKNWGKLGNQEERRKEILEVQKSNRNNKLDRFRGILELVNAVEENEIFKTRKVYYRPSIYVAGFNKTSPSYSNVLMLSEWMIEKPDDFIENWYAVPCPKAVRMLVVANQGMTKCYSKYGQFRFQARTLLPGGNPSGLQKNKCCVLDCFYHEKTKTMFILDLLAWNCQPMTDGETEFRHYWLETQLSVLTGLNVFSKRNQIIFKTLPKVLCTPGSLNKFMMTFPMFEQDSPPMDGLLFYHKKAHYVAGQTPLVGWLFPFMVPEVIGNDVTLHEIYKLQKPEAYTNYRDYIQKFDEKHTKRKSRSRYTSTSAMDTADNVHQTEGDQIECDQNKMDDQVECDNKQTGKMDDQVECDKKQTGKMDDQVEIDRMDAQDGDKTEEQKKPIKDKN